MSSSPYVKQSGFSLIEALIAVVILSFGMLALASLQANLFRAGAEVKARALATALAQGQIEDLRTYRSLVDVDPAKDDYQSIATGAFGAGDPDFTVAGVTYQGCIQVRRFRFDRADGRFEGPGNLPAFTVGNCADAGDPNGGVGVSGSVPEFKEVTASVGWTDQTGEWKVVQLKDTIAAISPDDALQLAKEPPEPTRGPEFRVAANSIGASAGMVPIAIGSDRTAASTNPTPTQYVDSLSSVTSFDVLTFSGSDDPDALQVRRRVAVSAVSCVCQNDGGVSSATTPAYEPTVWNGKLLSYMPASLKPDSVPIGTYNGSNSDSGVTTICTICCRDHNDSNKKRDGVDTNLRFDPYRSLLADGSHQHYGFKKKGQGYVLDPLLPLGAETNNEYVEACRVIRVGGRLHVAVDGHQNNMMVTALNPAQDGFQQTNFIERYSGFVQDYAEEAVTSRPAGYPAAPTKLSGPSDGLKTAYQDILEPSALDYASSSTDRKLLAFGLYIDYLSPETIQAFQCAVAGNDNGDCKGLGTRDPLEYIPFYAVNLASLGKWETTPHEEIVNIDGATYNNQGRLATQGGLAKWGSGSSQDPVPGKEEINISNSGLTATVPIDLDDASTTSFVTDTINFLKAAGVPTNTPKSLIVKVAESSTITLQKIGVSSPAGTTPCDYSAKDASSTCTVKASDTSTTVRFSNYTTSQKVQGNTVIYDRKICLPNDVRISSAVVYNNGTINEYLDLVVNNMNTTDHTLVIEIQNAAVSCDQAAVTLTPAN